MIDPSANQENLEAVNLCHGRLPFRKAVPQPFVATDKFKAESIRARDKFIVLAVQVTTRFAGNPAVAGCCSNTGRRKEHAIFCNERGGFILADSSLASGLASGRRRHGGTPRGECREGGGPRIFTSPWHRSLTLLPNNSDLSSQYILLIICNLNYPPSPCEEQVSPLRSKLSQSTLSEKIFSSKALFQT